MKVFSHIATRSVLAGAIVLAALLTSATAWADLTKDQARTLSVKAAAGNRAALKTLQAQAQKGNINAQFSLGGLYNKGKGVARDYAQAAQWYLKAAEQGDAGAQTAMGLLYITGSIEPDCAQAAQWFGKAAEQGDATAQSSLGTLYDAAGCPGVATDYAKAAYWYRKAAEQGDAYAQTRLGTLYKKGLGVAQSYTQAAQWWRKAAAQGNTSAQHNLDVLKTGK